MRRIGRLVLPLSLLLCAPGCGKDTTGGGNGNDGNGNENGNSNENCVDVDQDGYGEGCAAGSDCNDLDRDMNPGSVEICGDGKDNNCSGAVDEGCPCVDGSTRLCTSVPGLDPQHMGYDMVCRPGVQQCQQGLWATECVGEVGPRAETCNGLDDNCDGAVDEGLLNPVGVCGSASPLGPDEDCGPTGEGNGLDDNGNGQVDETCSCAVPGYDPNLPREHQPCYSGNPATLGVGACHGGFRDCNGTGQWGPCVGEVLPSPEACAADGRGNGVDEDCDGFVDETCLRCDGPSEPEVCDERDNNCNGAIDEGATNACGTCAEVAATDTCDDGLDNNCDGNIDEDCPNCSGTQPCYPGPPEKAGVGACAWGERTCDGEFWGPCTGAVLPRPEDCGTDGLGNGVDEDCDGIPDDGCVCFEGDARLCGDAGGSCEYGTQTCHANVWSACEGGVGPQPEDCNGLDDDCDGLVDEGLLNACGTCGESCYLLPVDPTQAGTPDTGIAPIGATDPENPTGRSGITLTKNSFIPPYLWAANHTVGTVTKYNTDTYTEDGVYWVAASTGTGPSRTAVDLEGNMWVGGREDGRVTKVLWDKTACPAGADGIIQTHPGGNGNYTPINSAGNPLADECVVYSAVPQPNDGVNPHPRPSVRGLAASPDGRMWIGYTGGGVQSIDPHTYTLGTFHDDNAIPRFSRNATTGVWTADGVNADGGGVYGLVVDSNGKLYISTYNHTGLAVFDTNTETWEAYYVTPAGCDYGIAVDYFDRVWLGGYPSCAGVRMFDPATKKIHDFIVGSSAAPTPGQHIGVTYNDTASGGGSTGIYGVTGVSVEPETGNVWASFYPIGYTGRLIVNETNFAASEWIMIGTTRDSANAYLSGVSADLRGVGFDYHGFAWTLGLGSGRVFKIDPSTNTRHTDLPTGQAIGTGAHYTYSDFTGSTALNFTAPRGFWRYRFDSGFAQVQVDGIHWEAYVPANTGAGIRIRALDAAYNPISDWIPAEITPGSPEYVSYPTLATAQDIDLAPLGGPLVGANFEVEIRLTRTERDVRPIVHDVRLLWQRP